MGSRFATSSIVLRASSLRPQTSGSGSGFKLQTEVAAAAPLPPLQPGGHRREARAPSISRDAELDTSTTSTSTRPPRRRAAVVPTRAGLLARDARLQPSLTYARVRCASGPGPFFCRGSRAWAQEHRSRVHVRVHLRARIPARPPGRAYFPQAKGSASGVAAAVLANANANAITIAVGKPAQLPSPLPHHRRADRARHTGPSGPERNPPRLFRALLAPRSSRFGERAA